jgi:7-carboxy-7-deazaguanine synthase
MTSSVVIAEAFAPTVQGEGPSLGRRCGFIRLMGCNLACSFCDTPYTWDARRYDLRAEGTRTPVPDLLAHMASANVGLVVLTGGEPLLWQHQDGWHDLLAGLANDGREVEVETNGTILPTPRTDVLVTRFNVSPKLTNSGQAAAKRVKPAVLSWFGATARQDRAALKYVCRTPADLAEVEAQVRDHGLPRDHVYIMPEGRDADTLDRHTRALADQAIALGYNLTTRLHVLLWSDERGR